MKLPEPPRLIDILVWCGVAAVALSVVAVATLSAFLLRGALGGDLRHWLEGTLDASSMAGVTLGEEGGACGGELRLPCAPGLVCVREDAAADDTLGVCATDEREVFPLGSEGVMCDAAHGCQPGLVCNRAGGAAGVCIRP